MSANACAGPGRCPVCGDRPRPVLRRGSFAVVRSPGCGLEWRQPLPDEAELRRLYGAGYLERWGARDAAGLERVGALKRDSARAFFREIRRHRASGRLLDVGCAAGFLLEVAREQGFDAYGLDPDPEGVALARRSFPGRIHHGVLDAGAFPGLAFDVVTLIDVFEHVRDPRALLDELCRHLAPGGVAAAVLPNVASFSRRALRRRWPYYAPEHLYHWSPRALRRFLGEAGWQICALRTGIRKTFTGRYLAGYAAALGSWLPPGVGLLGDRRFRIPTGEMLVVAAPREDGATRRRPDPG